MQIVVAVGEEEQEVASILLVLMFLETQLILYWVLWGEGYGHMGSVMMRGGADDVFMLGWGIAATMDVPQDELPLLYTWIDGIPLSRPKRNISRDFSDAGNQFSRVDQLWICSSRLLVKRINWVKGHPKNEMKWLLNFSSMCRGDYEQFLQRRWWRITVHAWWMFITTVLLMVSLRRSTIGALSTTRSSGVSISHWQRKTLRRWPAVSHRWLNEFLSFWSTRIWSDSAVASEGCCKSRARVSTWARMHKKKHVYHYSRPLGTNTN